MKTPRKKHIPLQRLPWPKEKESLAYILKFVIPQLYHTKVMESLAFDLNSAKPHPFLPLPKGMEPLAAKAFDLRMAFPLILAPKKDEPEIEERLEKLIENILFSPKRTTKSSKGRKRKTTKGAKTTAGAATIDKEDGIKDFGKSIYWAKNPTPVTLQPYGKGPSAKVPRAIKVRLYPTKTQEKEILYV